MARKSVREPPYVRELASFPARTIRRPFFLGVDTNGELVHEELPRPGIAAALLRRGTASPVAIAHFRGLLTDERVASLPAELGAGESYVEAHLGAGPPRVVRFTPRILALDLGPVGAAGSHAVLLLESLVQLMQCLDGDAPLGPKWQVPEAVPFPTVEAVATGHKMLRWWCLHPWDGVRAAEADSSEIRLCSSGAVELLEWKESGGCQRLLARTRGRLSEGDLKPLFDQVSLAIGTIRAGVGCAEGSNLDQSCRRVLEYFDGGQIRASDFRFGRERGHPIDWGKRVPSAEEDRVFRGLDHLLLTARHAPAGHLSDTDRGQLRAMGRSHLPDQPSQPCPLSAVELRQALAVMTTRG